MKIEGKRLELSDNSEDINMRNRPPDIQGPPQTVDLTHLSMRLS